MGHLILGIIATVALAAALFATGPSLKDAALKFSRALPASTSAVTSSGAGIIDTEVTTAQGTCPIKELLLTYPALTTGQLPDTKVMVYKLIQSANADLSSPSDVYGTAIITQTGAGGAGAAGGTKRIKPPSDSLRYLGLVITPSGSGTGDASGATATLEVLD
jgi:hypothetical protein